MLYKFLLTFPERSTSRLSDRVRQTQDIPLAHRIMSLIPSLSPTRNAASSRVWIRALVGTAIAATTLTAACGTTFSQDSSTLTEGQPEIAQAPSQRGSMTPARMVEIARSVGENVQAGNGAMELVFEGVPLAVFWDESHDRMRIISPIGSVSDLSEEQMQILLEANFHVALDGRYATSGGTLFAAFIHPLSPLDDEGMRSGIRQVSALVRNFGSSYSSDELNFGTGQPQAPPEGFLDASWPHDIWLDFDEFESGSSGSSTI